MHVDQIFFISAAEVRAEFSFSIMQLWKKLRDKNFVSTGKLFAWKIERNQRKVQLALPPLKYTYVGFPGKI